LAVPARNLAIAQLNLPPAQQYHHPPFSAVLNWVLALLPSYHLQQTHQQQRAQLQATHLLLPATQEPPSMPVNIYITRYTTAPITPKVTPIPAMLTIHPSSCSIPRHKLPAMSCQLACYGARIIEHTGQSTSIWSSWRIAPRSGNVFFFSILSAVGIGSQFRIQLS
jgi:hypothetical protein